jgi:hypothetical protein
MTLSTSRFKNRLPTLALLLLFVGVMSWLLAAFYTLRVNPEIRDFTNGAKIKAEWNRSLRDQYPSNYIVFGGSSSSFSVDPELAVKEFNFPLSNLALGAGLGAKVLIRYAAYHARPGDTLVMTMEPSLFSGSAAVPQMGQQFSIAMGHVEWASESNLVELSPGLMPATYLSALRPGGAHFFTLLGKVAMRRPLYRYKIGEFLPTGQKETDVRAAPITPRGFVTISPAGHSLLASFRHWSQTNHIRVIYTLPWAYSSAEGITDFRKENLYFLGQMLNYFPVLAEKKLGAYSNAEHFADTAYHLRREGAKIRTRELLEALQKSLILSTNELTSLLSP